MAERQLDPKKSWYEQAQQWIMDNGGKDIGSVDLCERLRGYVPYVARYPEDKTGITVKLAYEVKARDVLTATSAQIKAGLGIGKKTMELLGRFLREHNAKLADGWDGS